MTLTPGGGRSDPAAITRPGTPRLECDLAGPLIVKTMELHLSIAYRKLGIASRRALASAPTQERIVPA